MKIKFSNENVFYSIIALLAILFLHTAVSKFLNFSGFVKDMNNQPFPNEFTPFLVWFIPLTEIGIVFSFFFDKVRIVGLYASLILMSGFTVYTALVLAHVFAYVPCSCGGVVKYLSWKQHLVFNVFFVGISYWAIRLSKKNKQDFIQIIVPRFRY